VARILLIAYRPHLAQAGVPARKTRTVMNAPDSAVFGAAPAARRAVERIGWGVQRVEYYRAVDVLPGKPPAVRRYDPERAA
jgi:hypothetical protein